ncbi:extracellular solute-binding protein [Paenibacillus chungangensis]|uniref:Extracellular solute-binding protein n=1 Tax=Paenibacillus chungangensis TaxID=696535 RepID=A0ABW3HTU2_9BACL
MLIDKKRAMLLFVVCILAAVLLGSYSSVSQGTDQPPSIVIKAAVPSFERDRNTLIDQEFERRTGMKFDWLQFPVHEYNKRINQVLTSAGEKPDIFIVNKKMVQRFGSLGLLLDLRPYLDRMPNLRKWTEQYPDIVDNILTEEGKLHAIDGFNTYGQMPTGYMLREDIFYRNGMLLPASFDELYESLKRLKQIYPDSKPISNRWGAGIFLEQFYNAYRTRSGIYFSNDEMSFKFGPFEPNFKKAVEMARKFYTAELIDPDFATVAEPQFFENLINGQTFALFGEYFVEMDDWVEMGKKSDSFFSLKAVLPFVTGTGLQALQPVQYPASNGSWMIAVNANSPYIEELIKLIDMQYSEEIIELTNWGIEGETFVRVNGERKYVSTLRTRLNPVGTITPKELGVDGRTGVWTPYDQDAEYARRWGAIGLESQRLYNDNVSDIGFFAGPTIAFKQDEMIEITKTMTPIENFASLKLIQFVTGELGMEKDWNDFLDELYKMGAGDILKLYQQKYEKLPDERKVLNKTMKLSG